MRARGRARLLSDESRKRKMSLALEQWKLMTMIPIIVHFSTLLGNLNEIPVISTSNPAVAGIKQELSCQRCMQ